MARRCYWDYVRIYTPGGSELLSAEGLNSVATEPGERGTTMFTGDFVLKPGEGHTVQLSYALPAATPMQPYRLFIRKQAGTRALNVNVTLPTCRKQVVLAQDIRWECP
jgi:hypothetical protein